MRLRNLGWVVVLVGAVLLVLSPGFDDLWERSADGAFASVVMVVGAAIVLFATTPQR